MCRNLAQRIPQSLPVQSIATINFTLGRTKNFMTSIPLKIGTTLRSTFENAFEIAQAVNLLSYKRLNQKFHVNTSKSAFNSATSAATNWAIKIAQVKNFAQCDRPNQKFHKHTFFQLNLVQHCLAHSAPHSPLQPKAKKIFCQARGLTKKLIMNISSKNFFYESDAV